MWIEALALCAIPSRFSGGVAAVVAALLWALGSVLLVFGLTQPDIGLAGAALLMGMFLLPGTAALLFLGGLVNRRWTARGLMLVATTGLLVLGWMFLGLGFGGDTSAREGAVVSTLFFTVPVGFSVLLTLGHVVGAVPEVRAEVERLRTEWLTTQLDLRGWLDRHEIEARTGWALERAEAVADAAGFDASLEGERLRLDRVAARHRERILAMVQTRGKVSLAEVERELQEPRDALELRIAELQASGDFHGFLDQGVLASLDLGKLRALGRCPACAGELDLAGQGLIRCESCGSVVYL